MPLYSWGHYPPIPQTGQVCQWRGDVPAALSALVAAAGTTLPFGCGRSYGDSCLAASDRVLQLRGLDRFLATDWDHGIVRAEAGVTLAELLAASIPHGWFLPVTPGTQFATLGGAIANDVHGKNHHVRGTFGNHVRAFELCRHGEQPLTCSPAENPALFAATIGGLGLTGVITWAEIGLLPIRTSWIDSTVERFGNLSEFFALSAELDAQHEYSVAWIDCLASGSRAGRGVYVTGDHAAEGPLRVGDRRRLNVPITPPVSMVAPLALRGFNEAYWRAHPERRTRKTVSYEPFFYPLDRIQHWNRMYGPRGFQQYQCVIPEAFAAAAMQELLGAIAAFGQGSFLAVLKRCGDIASPGLLSFPMPGTSLALDFAHSDKLAPLFARLDAIVGEAGGRLYPAKDAHMSGNDFRRMYPQWEQVERLRDPALLSRFWQRVTA